MAKVSRRGRLSPDQKLLLQAKSRALKARRGPASAKDLPLPDHARKPKAERVYIETDFPNGSTVTTWMEQPEDALPPLLSDADWTPEEDTKDGTGSRRAVIRPEPEVRWAAGEMPWKEPD